MDVELREIVEFLHRYPPFDRLDRDDIVAVTSSLRQRYYRRGDDIVTPGESSDTLFVVRSGAVEICSPDGDLLDVRDVGDCFGYSTLVASGPSRYLMRAVEDSLTLVVPRHAFDYLSERHPNFVDYFGDRSARIRDDLVTSRVSSSGGNALGITVADLLTRDAVTCAPDTGIRSAAHLMTTRRVSSVMVMSSGRLIGIVTDRDVRARVVAAGVDSGKAIREVMTENPVTVDGQARAFDATIIMMNHGVRHLPVVDNGAPVGVISATALLQLTHADPVYLSARIDRAVDRAAVIRHMAQLPGIVSQLVRRAMLPAADIGTIITATADAATRRLVDLAVAEHGPAPVRFCWVVAGSQARGELGVASDQDSALILAHAPDSAAQQWIDRVTAEVRDGLTQCGFPECPGNMMATNPQWQMTAAQWADRVSTWVHQPEADHVLDAQVFFDMRAVAGDVELVDPVRHTISATAAGAPRFLAHLARTAADWHPPLGFFRGLVVEKRGDYRHTLDLKAGGLSPVVQIARLHALSAGLAEVGTIDRLQAAVNANVLTRGDASDLEESFAFLRGLQLKHHATCIEAGQMPDNHIDPSALSHRDRHRLRAAFRAISEQQHALALRYPIRQM